MKSLVAISVLVTVGLFAGWVVNIVKFAQLDFQKPLKAEIVRGIGIVVQPLGGVIGFININDN